MGFAIVAGIVFFVVLVVVLARRSGTGGNVALFSGGASIDCYPLLQQGVPARGILIKVSSQRSTKGTPSSGLYEVRAVTIDVEKPGSAPYQCDCSIQVPARLCRFVLPGATLELRVNPNNPRNIAVFGPGAALPAPPM